MICPKLSAGSCLILRSSCTKKYKVKMQDHKSCSVFSEKKGGASEALSKAAKKKAAKKAKRRRK